MTSMLTHSPVVLSLHVFFNAGPLSYHGLGLGEMKHCPELKDSCVPKGGQTEGGACDRMMRGRRGESVLSKLKECRSRLMQSGVQSVL